MEKTVRVTGYTDKKTCLISLLYVNGAAGSSCRLQVQDMKKQTSGNTFRKCKVYDVHPPKSLKCCIKGISNAQPWFSPHLQYDNQNARLSISLHCVSASK